MHRHLGFGLLVLLLWAGWDGSVSAHCPRDAPPILTLKNLRDGVSEQRECFPEFSNFCRTDTFYRDTLMEWLVSRYQDTATKNVFIGYVDSVRNYYTYVTYPDGYVDTVVTEDFWISVQTLLKGDMPERKLFYSVIYPDGFPKLPLAYTYMGLVDTPFVAFFTGDYKAVRNERYNMIMELSLGPVDGCYFEPTVNFIVNNRITKKGAISMTGSPKEDRLPGVSVSFHDFLKAVGHADVPVPPIRKQGIQFRYNGAGLSIAPIPDRQRDFAPDPHTVEMDLFNVKGQGVRSFRWQNTDKFSAGLDDLSHGPYLLRMRGLNWGKDKRVFLLGQTGAADTAEIRKKPIPLGR